MQSYKAGKGGAYEELEQRIMFDRLFCSTKEVSSS